jgi:hypothetical protein
MLFALWPDPALRHSGIDGKAARATVYVSKARAGQYYRLVPQTSVWHSKRSIGMAGPKKLSPSVVRKIFQSKETAPATAKRYKVSTNLVYLIKGGRIHKDITMALGSPQIAKRERGKGTVAPPRGRGTASPELDTDRLADAIAEKVMAQLASRLGGKG